MVWCGVKNAFSGFLGFKKNSQTALAFNAHVLPAMFVRFKKANKKREGFESLCSKHISSIISCLDSCGVRIKSKTN